MATAHEDVATGGRRRGRRNLGWGILFCLGRRRERGQVVASSAEGMTTPPWERSRRRRKKRTVPVVDEDLAGTAVDSEVMMRRVAGVEEEESRRKRKGLRLPGCCFLAPPASAPGRKQNTMDSCSGSSKQRHPERTEPPRRSQSDDNSLSAASHLQQATGGSTSNGSRSRGAEQPRGAPPADTKRAPTRPCVGAFGPVVGLPVVVAVSMAGLLVGRLWAVACVCAWLAALSRLRQKEATTAAAGEVAVDDVDWTDHKRPVVLRVLLERDRRKAVEA